MTFRRSLLSVLGCLALVSACGGDDSPSASSGVDGSKQLGSLTPTEAQKVCTSSAEYLADSTAAQQMSCKVMSTLTMMAGGTAAACQTAYSDCLKQPASGGTADGGADSCSFPTTCTATVAEYEKCLTDARAAADSLNGKLKSCDLASLVTLATDPNAQDPASCAALETKCPGVSPTSGMTDTGM